MPAPRSLARRLPRVLASLVVLAAVTAGLPWILATATTAVWASGVDALTHLLTRADTGAAFLLALVAVGWVAWALFVLSLLVELHARIRGRTAPSLPGLHLSQRAAGTLVGGILLLFASSTLASAAPALAGPAEATTISAATAPAAVDVPQTTAHAPAAANADQTYTVRDVRPAESLWSIAERVYGHGEQYTKIADANEGRIMADGAVFHADAPIRPGWTLRLPGTASTSTAPPAESYTVAEGDTLWKVAEEQLGDGDRYTELFDANKGKPQPGGGHLTHPDDIRTGWQLTLPRASAPSDTDTDTDTAPTAPVPAPARPAPAPAVPAPPTAAPADVPDRAEHPAPTPARTAVPVPVPAAPTADAHTPNPPSAGASSSAQPAAPAADDGDVERDLFPKAAGIGMLAAGGLLLSLGILRVIQRRRRKPGELPASADNEAVEQALHAVADIGSLELLDLALRTLAHHADEEDLPLPSATGARITADTVELLLPTADQQGEPALAPFTADTPGRWVLDRAHDLLEPAEAMDVPAPYPGLVTLGTDTDGNHLLINLNVARVLLLDGTPADVRDTARVLALEAATSTWSDHAEIITVGIGDELPTLLPQNRLRAVPHLAAARADLAELLLEQRQQADGDDAPPRMPWTLVCAAAMEETEAKLLADILTAARELPVALVLPAQGTAGAFGSFEDAVHLAVGAAEPQYVDVLDADLIIQSLPEADYQAFVEHLRQADQPARPAEEPWTLVPPTNVTVTSTTTATGGDTSPVGLPATPFAAFTAPVPERSSAETTEDPEEERGEEDSGGDADQRPEEDGPADTADPHSAPEVQVLGPVAVTGIQGSGHGPKLAQLAAYLYFKPGPPDAVRDAMNPRSPWGAATLQTRISQLRNGLGADADGNDYVPRGSGVYKLSPKVGSDWDRFTHLAERGLAKGPSAGIPDLEAALGLVRGAPFGGTPPAWAAARYQEMLVRLTDTAHTLATWHRTGPRPDLAAARRAVRLGLDIDDSAELLYQDWMHIENQAGNRAGVRTAYETILTINRRLDVSTEPETDSLYEAIVILGG